MKDKKKSTAQQASEILDYLDRGWHIMRDGYGEYRYKDGCFEYYDQEDESWHKSSVLNDFLDLVREGQFYS